MSNTATIILLVAVLVPLAYQVVQLKAVTSRRLRDIERRLRELEERR